MFSLPATGGSGYDAELDYGAGKYTGISDTRMIVWNPSATSPVNGKAGTYESLYNGRRFSLGQFPTRTFQDPLQ
jgi:hypothetical protein